MTTRQLVSLNTKNKEPERIFVTLEDYELTIKDKSEPSTKQEF